MGAAFHPIIHMGYGFAGSSSKIITDGLAYLHHSYLPPALYDQVIVVTDLSKFGARTLTPTEVLGKLHWLQRKTLRNNGYRCRCH